MGGQREREGMEIERRQRGGREKKRESGKEGETDVKM